MSMPVFPSSAPQGPPMQQVQQQQQQQEKLDNISKVKTQVNQLKDSLNCVLRAASYTLQQNHYIDTGLLKTVDVPNPRFEKAIEEFFSVCDQIEYNLKTAIECQQQGMSSQRYLPLLVYPTRTEPVPTQELSSLTYPQYLSTVRSQISYAKEVQELLLSATQNSSNE